MNKNKISKKEFMMIELQIACSMINNRGPHYFINDTLIEEANKIAAALVTANEFVVEDDE